MSRVRCVCLNDSDKPKEIPASKWVTKDEMYHIIHVYVHPNQGGVQGVDLSELELDESCKPFETYRLNRFAILAEDLAKFIALLKHCSSLEEDGVDVNSFVESLNLELV